MLSTIHVHVIVYTKIVDVLLKIDVFASMEIISILKFIVDQIKSLSYSCFYSIFIDVLKKIFALHYEASVTIMSFALSYILGDFKS